MIQACVSDPFFSNISVSLSYCLVSLPFVDKVRVISTQGVRICIVGSITKPFDFEHSRPMTDQKDTV